MRTASFHSRQTTSRGSTPTLAPRRSCAAAAMREIVSRIYRNHPVLVDRSNGEERKLWPVRYHTMFHMANDSELFETAQQLEDAGAYRVPRNRYKRGETSWASALSGTHDRVIRSPCQWRRIQPRSERQSTVRQRTGHRSATRGPGYFPRIAVLGPDAEVRASVGSPGELAYCIAFRDVTSATNERTMIAAVAPVGLREQGTCYCSHSRCLRAWLHALLQISIASLALDFVAKCKLPGVSQPGTSSSSSQ